MPDLPEGLSMPEARYEAGQFLRHRCSARRAMITHVLSNEHVDEPTPGWHYRIEWDITQSKTVAEAELDFVYVREPPPERAIPQIVHQLMQHSEAVTRTLHSATKLLISESVANEAIARHNALMPAVASFFIENCADPRYQQSPEEEQQATSPPESGQGESTAQTENPPGVGATDSGPKRPGKAAKETASTPKPKR